MYSLILQVVAVANRLNEQFGLRLANFATSSATVSLQKRTVLCEYLSKILDKLTIDRSQKLERTGDCCVIRYPLT